MIYPLPKRVPVGSPYGADRDGGKRKHKGVDLFAPQGTPIYATTDGRVVKSGFHNTAGNRIWLLGQGGNSFGFMHLDKIMVAEGQEVKAGQVIGTVGRTGNAKSTPPHLHFEHKIAGANVDPARFLKTGELGTAPLMGDFSKQVVGPMIRFPSLPFDAWLKPPDTWENLDEQGRKRVMAPPVYRGGGTTTTQTVSPKQSSGNIPDLIRKVAGEYGFTGAEAEALVQLANKESSFRVGVKNPKSSATGLFQLLKGNFGYMPNGQASIGNAREETIGGLNYIKGRYGTPSQALNFHSKKGWY